MTCRLSGAYDPYPVLILRIWIGVNDQQKSDRANHANDMPALLSILDPIREDDVQRIVPNLLGNIESQAVFGKIPSRLFRIPFKIHHARRPTNLYAQTGK